MTCAPPPTASNDVCCRIVASAVMRASIWSGPKIARLCGSFSTRSRP